MQFSKWVCVGVGGSGSGIFIPGKTYYLNTYFVYVKFE
jgi:hypothetical protein